MKYNKIEKLPTDKAFLHFEARRRAPDSIQVDYELVIPLEELDCRGTRDHKGKKARPKSHRTIWLDEFNNRRIPLGRTMVGSTNENYPFRSSGDIEIDLPFRDSAHAMWDNEKLGNLQLIYSMKNDHWELFKINGERK